MMKVPLVSIPLIGPQYGWELGAYSYIVAYILDMFDGMVARACNKTSKLGGVLDMVTDRAATTALLVILGGAYRDWCEIFAFLAALDIFSHWMHTTSCMMSNQHHKAAQVLERRSALLRFYYTN